MTLEPRLMYLYVPNRNIDLPVFDTAERTSTGSNCFEPIAIQE